MSHERKPLHVFDVLWNLKQTLKTFFFSDGTNEVVELLASSRIIRGDPISFESSIWIAESLFLIKKFTTNFVTKLRDPTFILLRPMMVKSASTLLTKLRLNTFTG